MATSRNPKLSRSDFALRNRSFRPSSLVIVPFFQAATLISPEINLATILTKRIVMMTVTMILSAPILFSFGRMASRRHGRNEMKGISAEQTVRLR